MSHAQIIIETWLQNFFIFTTIIFLRLSTLQFLKFWLLTSVSFGVGGGGGAVGGGAGGGGVENGDQIHHVRS